MKKYLIPLLGATLCLGACTHDIPEYYDLDSKNEIGKGGFNVLREGDLDLNDKSLYRPFEEMCSDGTKATYSNLIGSISGILSTLSASNVHQVVGTYKSIDVNDDTITVSGKIVYPKNAEIRNLLIVSHYTIGSNAECP